MRSLARSAGFTSPGSGGSSHSPLLGQQFHDNEEEGEQAEATQEQVIAMANDDPDSMLPVNRDDEAFEDLERGMDRRR